MAKEETKPGYIVVCTQVEDNLPVWGVALPKKQWSKLKRWYGPKDDCYHRALQMEGILRLGFPTEDIPDKICDPKTTPNLDDPRYVGVRCFGNVRSTDEMRVFGFEFWNRRNHVLEYPPENLPVIWKTRRLTLEEMGLATCRWETDVDHDMQLVMRYLQGEYRECPLPTRVEDHFWVAMLRYCGIREDLIPHE